MTVSAFELAWPDLTRWRAGNTGTEGVWHFDSGRPGRSVLLTALVHGNELCGAWALRGLLEAGLRPQQGRLTLAFCNLAAFDTFDPARPDASRFVEEDLNRQWSPERLATSTSLERRRARELLPFVRQADWLLDLHSMHEPGEPLLLAGLQPRNLELSRRLGAPAHVVIDEGHRDGTRLRDHGRFGGADGDAAATRSLLVECGWHGALASRTVACDMTVRFLGESGAVADDALAAALPGWRQPDAGERWVLRVTGGVTARSPRFRFLADYQGLELIPAAGTAIADNDGDPVVTPYDDCVLVMPSVRQAREGVTVVRFARREAL